MEKHQTKTGVASFRELITREDGITVDPNGLFVDKTLFIKEFLDSGAKILLITRPRRWGKTLALSMLQHFLSKELEGMPTKELFNNLKIAKYLTDPDYKKYQGTHPVILVNFKELKGDDFQIIEQKIKGILSDLYKKHDYLLKALQNKEYEFYHAEESYEASINQFTRILNKCGDNDDLTVSLKFLSELLTKYHGKKAFILIDEYDNAINNSFDKPEILEKLTNFFSNLFGACLKDNDANLQKGLITGILRVAKANIFSGLNNPTEETILDYKFSEHYGFTEIEVNELLNKADITNKQEIKSWYNGYIVGNNTVYNPWSIMQCIAHNGDLASYWADSANPATIKSILIDKSPAKYRVKIRELLKTGELDLNDDLERYISLEQINVNPEALWSLLLHTGYLTLSNFNNKKKVRLPNKEIELLIRKHINAWFTENPNLSTTANALLTGNIVAFEESLTRVLLDPVYSARMLSGGGRAANFDRTIDLKEFIYQFLIMAELYCINNIGQDYEVIAEPESISLDRTRPDLIVINHKQRLCVVGEIKVAKRSEDVEQVAKNKAMFQIDENWYGKKYVEHGYQLIKIAIAFRGLDFAVAAS
jgi:Predicted AAA-ATPase